MKMKLKDVKTNLAGLVMISNAKLPAKLNYAIAKNMRKLEEEDKSTEEARLKMCRQYAENGEDGQPVMEEFDYNGGTGKRFKMTPENRKGFEEEYNSLLEEETEIEIHTVKWEEIENNDNDRYTALSPAEVRAMEFMIEG